MYVDLYAAGHAGLGAHAPLLCFVFGVPLGMFLSRGSAELDHQKIRLIMRIPSPLVSVLPSGVRHRPAGWQAPELSLSTSVGIEVFKRRLLPLRQHKYET